MGEFPAIDLIIAKGLPRRRVVGVHLLRNSMIPIITLIGLDIAHSEN